MRELENMIDYNARKTEGTRYAEKHLSKWRRYPNGDMLVPPTRYRLMKRRSDLMIKELDNVG